MRTALFWAITQRVVVISYRRFGTTYRLHYEGQESGFLTLEDWPRTLYQNVVKTLPILDAY